MKQDGLKIRVLIVDDSSLARVMLKEVLEADDDIEVVAEAANGLEAFAMVEAYSPSLVTMDVDMPGMSGLDAIAKIMAQCPVPILVVTGERLGPDTDLGFRAIEQGALDFTTKFAMSDPVACNGFRGRVRELSCVPVFLHASPAPPAASLLPPMSSHLDHPKVIAIAGETGGARSIARIVSRLPADLSCAVAIAQHMPLPFCRGFVRFLEQHTKMPVVVVEDSAVKCEAATIYVPTDGAHLVCPRAGHLVAEKAAAVNGHRPSASRLFDSLVTSYGEVAVGIMLSGRGDDGADALSRMYHAGMLTIAESDDTAMTTDMPHAAIRAGSAMRVLGADQIAELLVGLLDKSGKTTAPPPYAPPTS